MKHIKNIFYPFYLKPKIFTKDYSSSHLEKGSKYETNFKELKNRKLVWKIEKDILESFADDYGPFQNHLDFAGGTGRISHFLKSFCTHQSILDISKEMLKYSKKKDPDLEVINEDFNKIDRKGLINKYDLVTAFRFFPNAEQALRESAAEFLSSVCKEDGYVICNNHRNFWSYPYLFKRLTFRGGITGMTNSQMENLFKRNGFKLKKTYSIGLLPQTEHSPLVSLPWKIVEKIEKINETRFSTKHSLGHNQIFIFQRNNKKFN